MDEESIGKLVMMDMTGTQEKCNGTSTESTLELRSASSQGSTQSVDVTPEASGEEYKAQIEGTAAAFVTQVLQDAKAATAAGAVEASVTNIIVDDVYDETQEISGEMFISHLQASAAAFVAQVVQDAKTAIAAEAAAASVTHVLRDLFEATQENSEGDFKAQIEASAAAAVKWVVQDAKDAIDETQVDTIVEDDVDKTHLDSIASALVTQALQDQVAVAGAVAAAVAAAQEKRRVEEQGVAIISAAVDRASELAVRELVEDVEVAAAAEAAEAAQQTRRQEEEAAAAEKRCAELYAAREMSLNAYVGKVIEIVVAEIVVQELKTRVREDVEAAVSAAAAAEAAEATQVKALIQEEKSRMEQGAAAEAAALFAEECALQAEREEAQIKAAREALEKLAAATSQINSEAQAMAAAEAIIAALAAAAAMKAFKEEEARVRALFREARKEENLKKQRAEDPERRLREDMAAQQRLPVIG